MGNSRTADAEAASGGEATMAKKGASDGADGGAGTTVRRCSARGALKSGLLVAILLF